jgi:hypothetical protein
MIPSTPRRTWLFIGLSLALYFAPDQLTPAVWQHAELYLALSSAYQGMLVLLGFGFGPAICRALVVREIDTGPLRSAVDQAVAKLLPAKRPPPALILAEHAAPFVLTAGLLPGRCQIFLSTELAGRLGQSGLQFLLARAAAHAGLRQRLAALLPILAFTVLLPDPKGLADWLLVAAFLALWLPLHWLFELDADRQAARMMHTDASIGLLEVAAATASPLAWLTPQPPMRWRLQAVGSPR